MSGAIEHPTAGELERTILAVSGDNLTGLLSTLLDTQIGEQAAWQAISQCKTVGERDAAIRHAHLMTRAHLQLRTALFRRLARIDRCGLEGKP